MKSYRTDDKLYNFTYLPAFASFLLKNHVNEFVQKQIDLSHELELPLLKLFSHLSPEQFFDISKKSNTELLFDLSQNKAKQHIQESLERWSADKLELVGRFDIVAEDITLINHIRQKVFKQLILKYTSKPQEILALLDEIDTYTFANNTAGTNTYINILTDKLEKNTRQLLEAQSIAQIGSFEWDFVTTDRINSPELRKIFETEMQQSFEEMLEKVHPDDRHKIKKAVAYSVITGKYECEYRYLINNREKVLWTKGIVHYHEDKPALMTGTVQDITERKRTERDLLQKTYELEISNANLEKFAFVASHDLQEPLRKILMHVDLLSMTEKERLSERGKALLDKIIGSTTKMKRLIKDILAYSTINPGNEKEKVQLEDLLEEVKAELDHLIIPAEATIITDGLPEAVLFPSQVKQLFQNLISNSIKFSKKINRPVITIRHFMVEREQLNGIKVTPAARYLNIEFSDNGIGIRKENTKEIFSLFKKLHPEKEFEGSGVGLAICKRVVENHGGSIEAFGKNDEGASFRIILPQ